MEIHFAKYSGCGNDFIMMDGRNLEVPSPEKIQQWCDRHYGIGADGLILLLRSSVADLRMRIFNRDGSEADMCGNGLRCFHAFARELQFPSSLSVETAVGIYKTSDMSAPVVSTRLESPNLQLQTHAFEGLTCASVHSGAPHVVCAVEDVTVVDVENVGKMLRHHPHFHPKGTNVNFFHVDDVDQLSMRTYEKGVEKETLACGTGAIASAFAYICKEGGLNTDRKIRIKTRSGEFLETLFFCESGNVDALEVSGPVYKIFEGDISSETN